MSEEKDSDNTATSYGDWYKNYKRRKDEDLVRSIMNDAMLESIWNELTRDMKNALKMLETS